ncbi:unnamed protein product [Leptosia nina]|uniref:Uncharacterized protein n=1 Tax=Leptosia nina TaxID=320188 RepID=A0AAV1J6D5_9NEOP
MKGRGAPGLSDTIPGAGAASLETATRDRRHAAAKRSTPAALTRLVPRTSIFEIQNSNELSFSLSPY